MSDETLNTVEADTNTQENPREGGGNEERVDTLLKTRFLGIFKLSAAGFQLLEYRSAIVLSLCTVVTVRL